jgi:phospholipid/cholesterol/gamma-HCH transport system substrate-binding protein
MSPFKAGLLAIVLVVVGAYFAYTQANPFADPYEFSASFNTVNNLAPDSPVRIAGVEVGTVKTVEAIEGGGDGATVTMEIEDHGLPIHEDAELKIRPRIFLEGNEFVDLEPGSPSAPTLDSGGQIPVNQTATPVQLGQVLSVLESDTREDLRTFLEEYAFEGLKGGGARSFNDSIKYWEDAYRNTAIANEALLGTQPGDLFRVLRGQQQTFEALASQPDDLQGLITNFNTTAAAFAAEDDALQATIPALRDVLTVGQPALASLNSSFPGIQRFAVDALPAARSSQETIPASFPFVRQLRLLFQPSELRGLSDDLRETIPPLARVNRRTIPLLDQNRALSKCTNDVLVPFANTPIPTGEPGSEPADSPDAGNAITSSLDFEYDPDSSGQTFAEQSGRAFVGLSGESRTGDANNEFFRANFKLDTVVTFFRPGGAAIDDTLLTLGAFEEDARPAPTPYENGNPQLSYRRPDFRPDFPCELSVTPYLRAPSTVGTADPGGQILGTVDELRQQLEDLGVLPPLPEAPIPTSSELNEIAGQVQREANKRNGDPQELLEELIDEFAAQSKGSAETEQGGAQDEGGAAAAPDDQAAE